MNYSEEERFTFSNTYGWDRTGFLKIMNGLDRKNKKLKKRIKEIEKEKESWRSFACYDMNLKSMLSCEIEKLTETRDIDSFLDFYYKYFCDYKKE